MTRLKRVLVGPYARLFFDGADAAPVNHHFSGKWRGSQVWSQLGLTVHGTVQRLFEQGSGRNGGSSPNGDAAKAKMHGERAQSVRIELHRFAKSQLLFQSWAGSVPIKSLHLARIVRGLCDEKDQKVRAATGAGPNSLEEGNDLNQCDDVARFRLTSGGGHGKVEA